MPKRRGLLYNLGGVGRSRASVPSPLDRLLGLFEPPTAEAHGLPWDLWLINSDGSGLRRLTSFYEDLPMAAFSPGSSSDRLPAPPSWRSTVHQARGGHSPRSIRPLQSVGSGSSPSTGQYPGSAPSRASSSARKTGVALLSMVHRNFSTRSP